MFVEGFPASTCVPYVPEAVHRVRDGYKVLSALRRMLRVRRLESVIGTSWQSVREALVARVASDLRQREAALAEKERAAEEATTCSLCMDHPKGVVFGCGHQTCAECSAAHSECPFCRKPIASRIVLFHT